MNSNWISVNDHLPGDGRSVIVVVKRTPTFAVVVKTACFFREGELALHDEFDPIEECYYDEVADEFYVPEGWYEMEREDDMAARDNVQGVIFWMALPDPPKAP